MGTHPIFESDFDCLTEREKAMNVFRLLGDLSHLGAIIILLLKIWKTRSCAGISGKTQAMFALVFITRYLDLFVHFVPAAGLACLINNDFSVLEILWTFSIYLEAVAILPQLFMISKTGEAETITSHYLFAQGSYRALYIANWIYRYQVQGFYDPIAIVAGIVQTILYCD